MTPLDFHVKQNMLAYPSLFPTRLKVLCHMYLVLGNGIDWTEDGVLAMDADVRHCETMRFDDLEERLKEIEKSKREGLSAKLEAKWAEELHAEMDAREERAKNIDAVASTPDFETIFDYDETDPRAFQRLNHGGHYEEAKSVIRYVTGNAKITLGEMPERVEQSYFNAALEILDTVIRSTTDEEDAQTLTDYRQSLLEGHTTFQGVTPVIKKIVIPAAPKEIKLREIGHEVHVIVDGVDIRGFSEYRTAAEFLANKFGLNGSQLMAIYHDYKEDYDRQCDG